MTDKPTLDQWAEAAAKEVKGKDLTWHTPEGIAVKPLYTAEDVAVDPGLPGFAPFTRGVRASMYTGRPWTIRRSEEHTSELQSLMRISYAVFCLKKNKLITLHTTQY